MRLLRARSSKRGIIASTPPTMIASEVFDAVLVVFPVAIVLSAILNATQVLAVLSFGIGPMLGTAVILREARRTARHRRQRASIDAAFHDMACVARDSGIQALDSAIFRLARKLLREISSPKERAGIRLLRLAGTLSTQEPIRPHVLENPPIQAELARTIRDIRVGLYYDDLSRAFQGIGKLIATQYYALPWAGELESDLDRSDAQIVSFLEQGAFEVFDGNPGPALRAARALLIGIQSLYPEEASPLPVLVLSWSRLKLLELHDLPTVRDPILWASQYEKTALVMLEMANAFRRKQHDRIVELIGKSYDPRSRVLELITRRRYRTLSANINR